MTAAIFQLGEQLRGTFVEAESWGIVFIGFLRRACGSGFCLWKRMFQSEERMKFLNWREMMQSKNTRAAADAANTGW
jgi:hypothetical protein